VLEESTPTTDQSTGLVEATRRYSQSCLRPAEIDGRGRGEELPRGAPLFLGSEATVFRPAEGDGRIGIGYRKWSLPGSGGPAATRPPPCRWTCRRRSPVPASCHSRRPGRPPVSLVGQVRVRGIGAMPRSRSPRADPHRNADCPVIACPRIKVCISLVPS